MIVAKPILREKETSNVILEPLCEAAHYCMALNCRIITGILG